MRQYPRDYLAWCFDGADPELSAAIKVKHYELMEAAQVQYDEVLSAYYYDMVDEQRPFFWPHERCPVPQYQLDTDRITYLLGVTV